jgi:hypothetical protein
MRTIVIALSAALACLVLSGCCCGDTGPSSSCKAEVKYKAGNYAKKAFVGKGGGKDKAAAKANACWDYCFEADPTFDGQFAIWSDGPNGKAYAKRAAKYKKKMTKRRIIIDDETSLERPFKGCVTSCEKNATAGKKGLKWGAVTCGGT